MLYDTKIRKTIFYTYVQHYYLCALLYIHNGNLYCYITVFQYLLYITHNKHTKSFRPNLYVQTTLFTAIFFIYNQKNEIFRTAHIYKIHINMIISR